MTTASGPRMPCTRLNARCARSRSSPVSPHRPGCRPACASTPSGTSRSRMIPAVGRAGRAPPRPLLPESQPSSCQRTRSAMAAAVSRPSCRQTRCSSWPCAVTASMPSRVQASPCAASRSCSCSASVRAANAAASTRSIGSSLSAVTVRSAGGCRTASGRWSRPAASRWASAPSKPNRASTSPAGSAAKSPRVRTPSRRSRSVRVGRPSASTGRPARNSGVPPGGTIRPSRAASPAAKTPSAMPTWLSTAQVCATCSTIRSAAASSPPR
ncbi:hypothetical protein B0E53_07091 [Micromonospora sp. MH33]|nr:hypothetical protein B0E53_07091 [Micromonospora sp. MH33]